MTTSFTQDTLRISTDSSNTQVRVDTTFHEVPIHETIEVDSTVQVDNSVLVDSISATPTDNEAVIRTITVSRGATTPASSNYTISEINADTGVYVPSKNNEIVSEKKLFIEKNLRSGEALPAMPFRNDWTIGVIIFSVILFSIVYASAKTFFSDIAGFFLFRETKEEGKNTFYWKSVFLNISSIFLISIFVYIAVSNSSVDFSGFKIWLYSVAVIAAALRLRHLICTITGLLSGATKLFNDYIITVYQTCRFTGFFLFIVITLFFYTPLITVKNCLIIGCIIISILYSIRILRLFLLFINHKISIFYFILYFCALEFLPVLILIKYFSGLI